jgi:hypothetical protein
MRGRLTAKVGGRALVFRLPTALESEDYLEQLKADPEDALEAAHDLAAKCCLNGDWAATADEYPLVVDKIVPALFRRAGDDARAAVRAAVRRWRAAETNLGRIAENLLAFKAYSGGAPDEKALAGALLVAEWVDVTRGTFRLLQGIVKGLRRR